MAFASPSQPDPRLPVRSIRRASGCSARAIPRCDEATDAAFSLRCRVRFHHDMLVHFHVAHRRILFFEAALEAPLAPAKQRKLVKAGAAVAQLSSQKKHSQGNVIAVESRILNRFPDFLRKFRSQRLIGIQQQNPIIGKRQRVHRPLPLLGPAALIMKLHHLGAMSLRDLDRPVGALRIDDVDFSNSRSDARQRGRLRASLRTGTITVMGRIGAAFSFRTCFDSSISGIGDREALNILL